MLSAYTAELGHTGWLEQVHTNGRSEGMASLNVAVRVYFSTFRARADSLHAKTNAHVPRSPKVKLITGECFACCFAIEVAGCHDLWRRMFSS